MCAFKTPCPLAVRAPESVVARQRRYPRRSPRARALIRPILFSGGNISSAANTEEARTVARCQRQPTLPRAARQAAHRGGMVSPRAARGRSLHARARPSRCRRVTQAPQRCASDAAGGHQQPRGCSVACHHHLSRAMGLPSTRGRAERAHASPSGCAPSPMGSIRRRGDNEQPIRRERSVSERHVHSVVRERRHERARGCVEHRRRVPVCVRPRAQARCGHHRRAFSGRGGALGLPALGASEHAGPNAMRRRRLWRLTARPGCSFL